MEGKLEGELEPEEERLRLELEPGSLRGQLERFAEERGLRLVWSADTDLLLEAGGRFEGSLAQVLNNLAQTLRASGAPYSLALYRGNGTLRVEER